MGQTLSNHFVNTSVVIYPDVLHTYAEPGRVPSISVISIPTLQKISNGTTNDRFSYIPPVKLMLTLATYFLPFITNTLTSLIYIENTIRVKRLFFLNSFYNGKKLTTSLLKARASAKILLNIIENYLQFH